MAYASRLGRARISSSRPQAAGVCDRCGAVVNHCDLAWQFDWRGATLQNTRILVCNRCLDTPQEQLRAIIVPADPMPIIQPRTQDYVSASTDYRVTVGPPVVDPVTGLVIPSGDVLITQDGQTRIVQPVGDPNGVALSAVQPLFNKVTYGPVIPYIAVYGDGAETVTVTCSAPHNLAAGAIIVAEGLLSTPANGTFSVQFVSATVFSYHTQAPVPGSALATGSSAIWSAAVGIPRDMVQFPQTGDVLSIVPAPALPPPVGPVPPVSVAFSLDFTQTQNSQYLAVV